MALTQSITGFFPKAKAEYLTASITERYESVRVKSPVSKYFPTIAIRTSSFALCIVFNIFFQARTVLGFLDGNFKLSNPAIIFDRPSFSKLIGIS